MAPVCVCTEIGNFNAKNVELDDASTIITNIGAKNAALVCVYMKTGNISAKNVEENRWDQV